MNVRQFTRELFARIKSDWYMPVTEHQIYDTTERVIGTYMGKPLYRKVVIFDSILSVPSGNTWVDSGIPNNDMEVIVRATPFASSGAIFTMFAARDQGTTVKLMHDRSVPVNVKTLILEYTKTTDAATESKVPFEPLTEYSTEERMIGYWIDGKPLYRKVVELSGTFSSGNHNFNHGITNLERVIRAEGTAISTTNKSLVLPMVHSNAGYNVGVTDIDSTSGILRVSERFSEGNYISYVIVILEYTKTTDT